MDLSELSALIDDLRTTGSDRAGVEAKKAGGGFPQSLAPTLCAFGNTPGGGTLILGLDEKRGFTASGVYDVADAQAALASAARRTVDPPLTFTSEEVVFEGAPLVVAQIDELPPTAKPCRVASSRKAYLRQFDGDYQLSQVEEQAFIANRATPTFDRLPVPGARAGDLRPDLLASYLRECRSSSSSLAAMSDQEILLRTGVLTGDAAEPTVAGLLALGAYPQQFLPNCVIQASVRTDASDPSTRAVDSRRFDGPIPVVLDEVLAWVRRNTRTRLSVGAAGQVRDQPEFPSDAVRELVANALIHRDLGPYALTTAVTLTLTDEQLVLSNPGGLWGITVDRLGRENVTSARNGHLLRICQNVRTPEGNRVVEALATGIPTVLSALRRVGMAPPRFHDQAVRFVVRVPQHALLAPDDLRWLAELPRDPVTGLEPSLTDAQRHALVAMRHGRTWSNQSFRQFFPMDSRDALRALTELVDLGLATAQGDRGQRVYSLTSEQLSGSPLPARVDPGAIEAPARDAAGRRRSNAATVLRVLVQDGPSSLAHLGTRTSLSRRQVSYALSLLRNEGTVTIDGGPGRTTTYHVEPQRS